MAKDMYLCCACHFTGEVHCNNCKDICLEGRSCEVPEVVKQQDDWSGLEVDDSVETIYAFTAQELKLHNHRLLSETLDKILAEETVVNTAEQVAKMNKSLDSRTQKWAINHAQGFIEADKLWRSLITKYKKEIE